MKKKLGLILAIFLALAILLGLGFAAQGWDFFMFRYWAPKYENAHRGKSLKTLVPIGKA